MRVELLDDPPLTVRTERLKQHRDVDALIVCGGEVAASKRFDPRHRSRCGELRVSPTTADAATSGNPRIVSERST